MAGNWKSFFSPSFTLFPPLTAEKDANYHLVSFNFLYSSKQPDRDQTFWSQSQSSQGRASGLFKEPITIQEACLCPSKMAASIVTAPPGPIPLIAPVLAPTVTCDAWDMKRAPESFLLLLLPISQAASPLGLCCHLEKGIPDALTNSL